MAISQDKVLQAIYDTLFAAFTSPPPGSPPGSAADQTFLCLNWPGQQVDIADFANAWSPTNPTGTMRALENFSRLADEVPSLNPMYSPNGQKVSKVFADVVTAKVVPPPEKPEAKVAYDKAFAFLNADGTDYDDSGKPITVKVDSPVYANYKRKKTAYENAVAGMMGNYFSPDATLPENQRRWAILGPTYQGKVTTAWNDLQNAQATKVEDALATLGQSSDNQVGQLFLNARRQFDLMRKQSVIDPGEQYSPSSAFPANWFAQNAAAEWTEVTVDSGSTHVSEHSDFTKYGAEAKASWGLWSGSGGFDRETGHEKMDKTTESLTAKFKFARITIVRPWLDMLVYKVGGWSTQAFAAGGLSDGTREASNKGAFPLLTTSFIAVRDVEIAAKWGHEDSSLVTSKLSTKASFGWGPFALSGNYSSGSKDKTFNSEFDNRTIRNTGLQIIGWVCTLVPFSPPKMS